MFSSLKEWCRFPVTIHSRTGTNAAGDPIASTVETTCFKVDVMQMITDKTGKEYASSSQVFFKEDTAITEDDFLSFTGRSGTFEIRKLSTYNDGTVGKVSLFVAYL